MRIVIIGQKWLGAETLKLCLKRGDTIAGVLAPGLKGEEYDRLYAAAQQSGIPVETCGRLVEARHIPPRTDLIIAAHAHAYISEPARQATRYGALGYHPSLLPRHRGRDAVRWTLHMRDPIAGGTAYWMDNGADTGPIAAQHWCHVLSTDTARTLWQRDLAPIGLCLIEQVLSDLDKGILTAVPQPDDCITWEPAFTPSRLSDP
ncbi:MAG: hypothetical protein LBQ81_12115 [Zoogloeaceae bacterium]|jgi:methionyl-tRNA formyltransferase|nr:hypothetical protein [Zoogloeaceae bacterium]